VSTRALEILATWVLAILWVSPLVYAVWTAFHPSAYATHFSLFAPLTLENFVHAWEAAPFARYFLNTTLLVGLVLVAQFVLCTPAAFAFARLA
jgi:sn-glycerol 3-phosphate transport system permease protein